MLRRRMRGWKRIRLLAFPIALSLVFSLAAVLTSAPSKADGPHGHLVDYSWIPAPQDIVAMRGVRPELQVPGLLDQACNGDEYDSSYGENYMSVLLAKTELLIMIDSQVGRGAIQAAIGPDRRHPVIQSPTNVAGCLDELDRDWSTPWSTGFQPHSGIAWEDIERGILAVPEFYGSPGTDWDKCDKSKGDWDFATAMLTRIWLLARPHFSPPVQTTLAAKVSRRAWLQGPQEREDTELCRAYTVSIPETENHGFLIEVSRYLHNEYLPPLSSKDVLVNPSPDVRRYDFGDRISGDLDTDNHRNGLTASMINGLHVMLNRDFLEYNARPYSFNDMIGLLDLYDFARDVAVQGLARDMLDMLMSKVATESQGELRSPPFRRRMENYWAPLFAGAPKPDGGAGSIDGDSITPMMQVWVGDLAPDLTPRNDDTEEATLAASTRYRPPDVLADIMLNPQHHIYNQGYDGQDQMELAYGQPGFVISGGGTLTDCPYPNPGFIKFGGRCPGSGNDSGTVMPIELIPRRIALHPSVNPDSAKSKAPAAAGDPSPPQTITSVINSQNTSGYVEYGNDCIGSGFACSASFADAAPTWVKNTPKCRSDVTDPKTKLVTRFMLFAWGCVNKAGFPGDSCFMVYSHQFFPGLSVLATHECYGAKPQNVPALFKQFVDYFSTGQGVATNVGVGIPTIGYLEWHATIRMPSTMNGLTLPGDPITFHEQLDLSGNHVIYYDTGDKNWQNPPVNRAVAAGTVANVRGSGEGQQLVLDDHAAGEQVKDAEGTLTAGRADGTSRTTDPRNFQLISWVKPNGSNDTVTAMAYQLPHHEQIDSLWMLVADSSGKQAGLVTKHYDYGDVDSDHQFPAVTVPADANHRYTVEVCYGWLRFMTSQDYRYNQQGTGTTDQPQTCKAFTAIIPPSH